MITLKLGRHLTASSLDAGPPRRPATVQRGVDADDLSYRPESRIAVDAFGEANAEPVVEVVFQGGVVGFRRRHRGFEQDPSVDGQPASVEGLHLVCYSDMGVQVGIPGSAVAVGERGRDQAADVDLPDSVASPPGEQGMAFDEVECILHGCLVRLLDLGGHVEVGDRPQRRH
jgi:hypothetical protein